MSANSPLTIRQVEREIEIEIGLRTFGWEIPWNAPNSKQYVVLFASFVWIPKNNRKGKTTEKTTLQNIQYLYYVISITNTITWNISFSLFFHVFSGFHSNHFLRQTWMNAIYIVDHCYVVDMYLRKKKKRKMYYSLYFSYFCCIGSVVWKWRLIAGFSSFVSIVTFKFIGKKL